MGWWKTEASHDIEREFMQNRLCFRCNNHSTSILPYKYYSNMTEQHSVAHDTTLWRQKVVFRRRCPPVDGWIAILRNRFVLAWTWPVPSAVLCSCTRHMVSTDGGCSDSWLCTILTVKCWLSMPNGEWGSQCLMPFYTNKHTGTPLCNSLWRWTHE